MKQKILPALIWVSLAFLVSGCMHDGTILGLSRPAKVKSAADEISSEIAILLSYNKFLNGLPKDHLEVEQAKAEKAFADFKAPIHRLRLALILSRSEPGSESYLRARALLSVDEKKGLKPDPVLRDFALYLSSSLLRLEEQSARHDLLDQKINELTTRDQAQSQKIKNLENQNQQLLKKIKEEEEERQKLQKMIEELKTVEKNIMKRDNGSPGQ